MDRAGVSRADARVMARDKIRKWHDLEKWFRDHREEDPVAFLAEAVEWEGANPEHIYAIDPDESTDAAVQLPQQWTNAVRSAAVAIADSPLAALDQGDVRPMGLLDRVGNAFYVSQGGAGPNAWSGSLGGSQHPDGWYSVAHVRFIVGCMYMAVLGNCRIMNGFDWWQDSASRGFRGLCESDTPILLIAASSIFTWLQIHVSNTLTKRIMTTILSVACEVFGRQHLVSLTLEWMVLATDPQQLRASGISTATMRNIWLTFSRTHGDQHYHTMVALYALCFHLMLVDANFAEAEIRLESLVSTTRKALGPAHELAVNALATLSRAQRRLGKLELSLETLDRALAAIPYGFNHPHRLELMLRKAAVLWKLDRKTASEELYWIVTRGRIATLGVRHEKTRKAHDSLVDVLKENGKWDERKAEAQSLLTNPQMAVKDYESWWKDASEAARREQGNDSLGDDSDA